MPFDPIAANDHLQRLAHHPGAPPTLTNAPRAELARSPAAARVAAMAADAGLFLHHWEHRFHRELPEDWLPLDRSDLADPPRWEHGILAERKYQSFRHDQAVGGFHPGHRMKWTTHELCHGLVGFAWRPGASRFTHALAGRLAELLPVALWYFLDEAYLRRCPDHVNDGQLFRGFCARCDAVSGIRADDADAERRLGDAKAFVERELAAVARSRRLGRPIPHLWATIDLSADGVAYAGAHGTRLGSDAFLTWAERFAVPGGGMSADLDALEERVLAVLGGIVGGPAPAPIAPSAAHGRARWVLQDLGWQVLGVWHDTGGEAADGLVGVIDRLATAVAATKDAHVDADAVASEAVIAAAEAYRALEEEWVIPPIEEVFSVGYPLPGGLGSAHSQLADGIRSGCPLAADLLGDGLLPRVHRFAVDDLANPARSPIGVRFARFLAREPDLDPRLAELARYEAQLQEPGVSDDRGAALGVIGADRRWRLAESMRVLRFDAPVVELAAGIDDGLLGLTEDGRFGGDIPVPEGPSALVVGRVGDGEVLMLDISLEAADALEALGDGAELAIGEAEAQGFVELGVLLPAAWSIG